MLLNIDEVSVQDARRILTLVCCAKRPLTVPELIDANAVELGDNPRLNPDGRLLGEDEIRAVCPGLVEIDTRPGGGSTVRIAHFSVQEYLESDQILQQHAAIFSVPRPKADAEVALVCLTYLLDHRVSRESITVYPFALYAANTWHEHFRDAGEGTHCAQHQALRLFQNSRGEFENWISIRNVESYDGHKNTGEFPSPVYCASLLGLSLILTHLLGGETTPSAFSLPSLSSLTRLFSLPGFQETPDLVNAQGGDYGNALQAASAGGHEQIVKLLLKKGADVTAQGGHYNNALQAASAGGYEQIVKLLLSKGADIKAQGGYHGNALQAASANGHGQIVKFLLENGADIKAEGGLHFNALRAASHRGHKRIVKLLLENGADIKGGGGFCGNALHVASAGGYKNIVKALLENGADINAQSELFGNALHVTSARGHEQTVKLLLKEGADVSAQGGHFGNALQAASARGHEQIVKLLLEKGADVSAQGGHFGNALQAASARGYEQIVKLLLEKGATSTRNAQGGENSSAFQAASDNGHENIVRLLLGRSNLSAGL
jgi:ankyrin repeat protein